MVASEEEDECGEAPGEPVNPFALGGNLLDYCVRKGWLIQDGCGKSVRYYATDVGKRELKERFDIEL